MLFRGNSKVITKNAVDMSDSSVKIEEQIQTVITPNGQTERLNTTPDNNRKTRLLYLYQQGCSFATILMISTTEGGGRWPL